MSAMKQGRLRARGIYVCVKKKSRKGRESTRGTVKSFGGCETDEDKGRQRDVEEHEPN